MGEQLVNDPVKAEIMAYEEDPYQVMAQNGREAGMPEEAIAEVLGIGESKSMAAGERYDEERQWVRENVHSILEQAADYEGDKVRRTEMSQPPRLVVSGEQYRDGSLTDEVIDTALTLLGAEEIASSDTVDKVDTYKFGIIEKYSHRQSNLGFGIEDITWQGKGRELYIAPASDVETRISELTTEIEQSEDIAQWAKDAREGRNSLIERKGLLRIPIGFMNPEVKGEEQRYREDVSRAARDYVLREHLLPIVSTSQQ